MRFLSGRAATLRHTFYDDEDAIAGIPSVSVTVWPKGASTSVFTGPATENSSSHEWSVNVGSLPTGAYTVQWQSTNYTDNDEFEVVGNTLFTVAEVRAADPDLADKTRFPASKITAYREQIESEFERITWRSFTQRTKTVYLTYELSWSPGDIPNPAPTFETGLLDLRAITAVQINGTASDATAWTLTSDGLIQAPRIALSGPYWLDGDPMVMGLVRSGDQLAVTLDYGFASVPPDVKRAAILRLRNLLAAERSGVPDRATSFVAENGGQFTLATAGMRGFETGLPDVDAVLKRYRFDILDSVI